MISTVEAVEYIDFQYSQIHLHVQYSIESEKILELEESTSMGVKIKILLSFEALPSLVLQCALCACVHCTVVDMH